MPTTNSGSATSAGNFSRSITESGQEEKTNFARKYYYNSKTGKTAKLEVDFNDYYFPKKYIVIDAQGKKINFPTKKQVAYEEHRYYDNITSIYKYE